MDIEVDPPTPSGLDIIEDETSETGLGLVIHSFEIRADENDNLFIFKEISKEAARQILEEMPHIVINDKSN